jgi:pimeloyl-ACP methyl ester carboxylesterase
MAMSSATQKHPTIILVGGSWHIPAHYSLITDRLRDAGRRVVPVRLPSIRPKGPYPALGKSFDAGAVASAVLTELDEGREVVIIMHSYGGIAGSEGAFGLSKEDRVKEGLKGGVVRMIYLSAFVIGKGVVPADFFPLPSDVTFDVSTLAFSFSLVGLDYVYMGKSASPTRF